MMYRRIAQVRQQHNSANTPAINEQNIQSTHKGPVMRRFDVSFDDRMNKRLYKQSGYR